MRVLGPSRSLPGPCRDTPGTLPDPPGTVPEPPATSRDPPRTLPRRSRTLRDPPGTVLGPSRDPFSGIPISSNPPILQLPPNELWEPKLEALSSKRAGGMCVAQRIFHVCLPKNRQFFIKFWPMFTNKLIKHQGYILTSFFNDFLSKFDWFTNTPTYAKPLKTISFSMVFVDFWAKNRQKTINVRPRLCLLTS